MTPQQDHTNSAAHKRRVRSGNLTDMEKEILEDNAVGFDRIVTAIDRLSNRAPHPALVWTTGVMVIVYFASLIADGNGVNVLTAAEATKVVMTSGAASSPTTTRTTAPETHSAPPGEDIVTSSHALDSPQGK